MIQNFLDSLDSINTKRSYSTALTHFISQYPNYRSISSNDALTYLQSLRSRNLSNSTINLRLSAVSSFLDYVSFITNEAIPNPFKNSRLREPSSQPEIEILSAKEVAKLFSVIKNPKHLALFKLLLYTGLRRSEATQLSPRNIINIKGDYYIRIYPEQSKSKKHRDIYIPTELKIFLDKIYDPTKDKMGKARYFPMTEQNVYKQLLKYCSLAKIRKHITPHILRHTVATTALENGASIQDVKEMLGHANINTTMRYVHFLETHKNSASRKINWQTA